MSERAKPWVGWMMATNPPAPHEHDAIYGSEESARRFDHGTPVPVVVTPLLPGDPRVGETWLSKYGDRLTILSGPIPSSDGDSPMYVATDHGHYRTTDLRRPPVMKTFVLPANAGDWRLGPQHVVVQAESKNDAVEKLAQMLTEVVT